MRWGVIFPAVSLVVVVGGWLAIRWSRSSVTVTRATQGPVVKAFYATGTLVPDREHSIGSNAAGIVTDVLVRKGQEVRSGQILATVRDDGLEYAFARAKAEFAQKKKLAADDSPALREYDVRLAAASDQLTIAQRELKRVEDMLANRSGSQSDVDHAADRARQLTGDVEAIRQQRAVRKIQLDTDLEVAKAALDTAQWNLDQQTIRSPIGGSVLDEPVSVGTRVAVNAHLMQVADVRPSELLMRAQVDEEDKASVRMGQTVEMTLYAFGGKVFRGAVERVYPKADPARRTFEVDVRIGDEAAALAPFRPWLDRLGLNARVNVDPDTEKFSAGMTGELVFVIEAKKEATVIPSQAVQGGAVWVVRDGNLVRTQPKLGLSSVERTEVIAGLQSDDQVVISPIGKLGEGQAVRTEWMDPQTAAALNRPKTETDGFRGFNR